MGYALYLTIVCLFAVWATAHLLLCVRLARRSIRHGAIGLLVPPLAIYYAQHFALGKITLIWVISLSSYLVALTAGFIG